MNLTKDIKGRKEYFSSKRKTDCYYEDGNIYYKNEKVISTKDILVKGIHNYENIMCAILVMKELNIPNKYTAIINPKFNFFSFTLINPFPFQFLI